MNGGAVPCLGLRREALGLHRLTLDAAQDCERVRSLLGERTVELAAATSQLEPTKARLQVLGGSTFC